MLQAELASGGSYSELERTWKKGRAVRAIYSEDVRSGEKWSVTYKRSRQPQSHHVKYERSIWEDFYSNKIGSLGGGNINAEGAYWLMNVITKR